MNIKMREYTVQIDALAGFTLVEVLVAMVILSVGLLGLGALTVGIAESNRSSRDLTVSTTLAQDKLEDIKKASYVSVVSEAKTACPSPYSDFQREVVVATDSPASGMKSVTVTVSWNSDEDDITLQTILVN